MDLMMTMAEAIAMMTDSTRIDRGSILRLPIGRTVEPAVILGTFFFHLIILKGYNRQKEYLFSLSFSHLT